MSEVKKTTTKTTAASKAKPAAKTEVKTAPVVKTEAKTAPVAKAKPAAAKAVNPVTTKAAKPAAAAKETKTAKHKITFEVLLYEAAVDAQDVYVVGNIAELGGWDAGKGLKLAYKNGKYTGSVNVLAGTTIEYKISNTLNWVGVEKGIWGEELCNHTVIANSDYTDVAGVSNWKK